MGADLKLRGLVLAGLWWLGCAPDITPWLRTPSQRAVLFGGVQSYASPAQAKGRLGLGRVRSDKSHRGRSRGCGARAFRYHVRVLEVDEATDLGCAGKLRLTFLNNKLVMTAFTPIRGAVYLARLVGRTPLTAPKGIGARRSRLRGAPPHTRVDIRRVGDTLVVRWADTRLLKAYWEVQSRGSSRYMK